MTDTVEEFLNADFVIPKSGGDMLTGWTGTREEADEIVRKWSKGRDGKEN